MKENILDVLMYLFENYLDEEESVNPDRDTLKLELEEAGFPKGEVEKALAWLEDLAELRNRQPEWSLSNNHSIRIFTAQEIKKIDVGARGFLIFLENIGVLDHGTRETAIDRIMALETNEIDIEHIKWVVLMVLFNQPGLEAAYTWMEDLVYEENTSSIH